MYAMHGALLFFISWDIRHYLPVVKFVVVLTIFFGLSLTALDVVVGMPMFWTVCEGPILFLLYGILLWLTSHVQGIAVQEK